MRFRTKILSAGKTAAGFEVPPKVVEGLGSGKVPLVTMDNDAEGSGRLAGPVSSGLLVPSGQASQER